MQPEKASFFAGLHYHPCLLAKPAHFIRAINMNIAMSCQIDQRQFHMVKKPSDRCCIRCHIPEDQPPARPEHPGYTIEEILDIRIMMEALAADHGIKGIPWKGLHKMSDMWTHVHRT